MSGFRIGLIDDHPRAWGVGSGVLTALVIAAGFWGIVMATAAGQLANALLIVLVVGGVSIPVSRAWSLLRGQVRWTPTAALIQAVPRLLFWTALCACLALGVAWIDLTPADVRSELELLLPLTVLALLGSLIPRTGSRWPKAVAFLLGALLLARFAQAGLREPAGDVVILRSPFTVSVAATSAGLSPLMGHHYLYENQRHAIDFVPLAEYSPDRQEGGSEFALEDHACFGAPLVAPASGMVVTAVDGFEDMDIGKTDPENLLGNHVIIRLDQTGGRYLLMAHLAKGSVTVTAGQTIAQGAPVGRCGNTGNTSEPHLHIQAQTTSDFFDPSIRTVPIVFEAASRNRFGRITKAGSIPVYLRTNDVLIPNDLVAR